MEIAALNSFAAEFNYDNEANLLQTIFYQNKNEITEQYNYKYDKKDSLFEVEFYNYLANEYVTKKITYPNKKSWIVKWYLNDKNFYIIETNSFGEDASFFYHFGIPRRVHIEAIMNTSWISMELIFTLSFIIMRVN